MCTTLPSGLEGVNGARLLQPDSPNTHDAHPARRSGRHDMAPTRSGGPPRPVDRAVGPAALPQSRAGSPLLAACMGGGDRSARNPLPAMPRTRSDRSMVNVPTRPWRQHPRRTWHGQTPCPPLLPGFRRSGTVCRRHPVTRGIRVDRQRLTGPIPHTTPAHLAAKAPRGRPPPELGPGATSLAWGLPNSIGAKAGHRPATWVPTRSLPPLASSRRRDRAVLGSWTLTHGIAPPSLESQRKLRIVWSRRVGPHAGGRVRAHTRLSGGEHVFLEPLKRRLRPGPLRV